MKIYNFSAYDRAGGASTRAFDISIGLVKLGHDVTLITNDFCHFQKKYHGEKSQVNSGVKCRYLETPKYRSTIGRLYNSVINFKRILGYPGATDIDVVIAPSVPLTTGLAGYLFAVKNGCKFIFEIRDVWPSALVHLGAISILNPIYWLFFMMEKLLYKKSDVIVTTLPNVSAHVFKSSNDHSKLHYLQNPIADDLISSKALSKTVEVKGDNTFLYAGGFGLVHDVDTLVDAAIFYLANFSESATFVFYGDGTKRNKIRRRVEALGLTDKIKLPGFLAKEEVLKEAQNASVLIAAVPDSKIFEFGINLNKLYLYLAAGTPICFAGNVPNDTIKENLFGRSVRAGDCEAFAKCLFVLQQSPDKDRRRLRMRMRKYVCDTLSVSVISRKYDQILSELYN